MADAVKRCPSQPAVWDGADRVDSSGQQQSPAEQLAEVSRQFLQQLLQNDLELPNNVEGMQQKAAFAGCHHVLFIHSFESGQSEAAVTNLCYGCVWPHVKASSMCAAAFTAAAAPLAELIKQLVAYGWLAWGGKLAGKLRSTSRVAGHYSGDPQLQELVSCGALAAAAAAACKCTAATEAY
jgi:hypothetical protein